MTRSEVEKISKRLEELGKLKDAKKIAEEYAENASLMPPGNQLIKGRTAVLEWFETWYREHPAEGVEIKADSIEVIATSDQHVIDQGTYTVLKDGIQLVHGSYVRVFQRIDGKLKILMDIWNHS